MPYRNLAEMFRLQAERLGPRTALRHKRHGLYHDITWDEYLAAARAVAGALCAAGVRPGDRVGLLAENRPEWLIADMGILLAGAVNVPPHAPLTAKQVEYQLADAGAVWLFVSTAAQLDKIRQVRAQLPHLRGTVVLDHVPGAEDAVPWRSFLQRGREYLRRNPDELAQREHALKNDDLATIMYTSGTTGNPKGVMLTHGNLLSNAWACNEMAPCGPESILLSWLPYSHIYARTVDHYLSLVAGFPLCLAESAETVVENLGEIQPTKISCVPRFYEKVLTAVSGPDPEKTRARLKHIFGPRIEWLCSGGAPLPAAIEKAYHDAGLLVLQGYGLTESSPVISFNRPDCYKLGTVGPAVPGVEVAIAPDGEVLTRGPHVMAGYWNNPQATAEAIKGGWLHTGDLGHLDEEGFLTISGRKKEILVLSNGKKLVPPHIEGLLLGDPCIDQAVVYGEGKNFLSALVVPNWDNLRKACPAANGKTNEQLATDTAVAQFLRGRIDVALADVSPSEQVKKFVIVPQSFSVEAEELTVSLKLRRNVIFEHYRPQLEALYQGK